MANEMPASMPVVSLTPRVPLAAVGMGQVVRGRYRMGRTFLSRARTGIDFRVMELVDSTGRLRCHAWPNRIPADVNPPEWTIVDVEFAVPQVDLGKFGRLNVLQIAPEPTAIDQVATLPAGICPIPGVVEKLQAVVAGIRTPELQGFLAQAFSDMELIRTFFRVPASSRDHHARPGSLGEHSVEAAVIANGIGILLPRDREQCVVGSLFHDVGKVRTHDGAPLTDVMIELVEHDDLTLEVLAPHLRWLEQRWPHGAISLRHAWTARSPGARYGIEPKHLVASVVRAADRISQEVDLHRTHRSEGGGFVNVTRWRRIWSPEEPASARAIDGA